MTRSNVISFEQKGDDIKLVLGFDQVTVYYTTTFNICCVPLGIIEHATQHLGRGVREINDAKVECKISDKFWHIVNDGDHKYKVTPGDISQELICCGSARIFVFEAKREDEELIQYIQSLKVTITANVTRRKCLVSRPDSIYLSVNRCILKDKSFIVFISEKNTELIRKMQTIDKEELLKNNMRLYEYTNFSCYKMGFFFELNSSLDVFYETFLIGQNVANAYIFKFGKQKFRAFLFADNLRLFEKGDIVTVSYEEIRDAVAMLCDIPFPFHDCKIIGKTIF